MDSGAEAIFSRLQGAVADGTVSESTIQETYDALNALPQRTERDRRVTLCVAVQVADLLLGLLGEMAPAELRDTAERMRSTALRRYGSDDTPYLRSRLEVVVAAQRMAAGDAAAAVAAEATARLLPDMAHPDDSEEVALAIHAVHGLLAAHEMLLTPEAIVPGGEASQMLQGVDALLSHGDFPLDQLDTVRLLAQTQRWVLDDTPCGHARALLVLLGIGLKHDPHAMPLLEPLISAIVEELTRLEITVGDAAVAPRSHAAQCAAFEGACAAELAGGAAVDEHLLQRWVGELQALSAAADAEHARTLETMLHVLALAEQHANGDTRTMVAAQRAGLEEMRRQLDDPNPAPLDIDSVAVELARMQRDADARIAAGESAEVLMTTLIALWPTLLPRLGDDPDPRVVSLLLTGFVETMARLEQVLPPAKREAYADTMSTMRHMMREATAAIEAPPRTAPDPLLGASVMRRLGTLQHVTDDTQPDDVAPWGRQLVDGLGQLMPRVLRACEERGRPRDDEEAARLKGRIDIVLGRLRGAGTDPERFVTQLRKGLRPFLLDLRHFERRQHAMLVTAPYPPRASSVDASAAHLVLGDAVRPQVEAALSAVGMSAAEPFGAGDPLPLRWHQLRRSALAVLDYTAYDPVQSDPPGPLPIDTAEREARLAAAAPVAATSYEHGWAMALGTPVIPLVRAGAPLPFDVTSAAVALRDDGLDLDRLATAIHGSLLADDWQGSEASAAATVAQLHAAYAHMPGAADLLAAAGDGHDGMAVVLAAEALIQHAPGAQRMLAFPGFAPVYPDAAAPPLLFHVTAFRPWSQACERAVRAACERAGWRYAIGHERLDPDIMAAIWRDVAQAALVVADVTALNPNAVLELGLAHGLGRPMVVISRQPDIPRFLPALAKVRVHTYEAETEAGADSLAALLGGHLARATAGGGGP